MAWEPDYITVEELAAYVVTDDADDTELAVAISAASSAINAHCNRQFGKVAAPELRTYTAFYDGCRWAIDIDDLMTTVGLLVAVGGDTVTDYTLTPANAVPKGRPWTRLVVGQSSAVSPSAGELDVAVTASWGWTAVPVPVTYACRVQAARFFKRRESPYGVAGSPDLGNELRLLSRVDPDVAVSLKGYGRRRLVA